MTTEILQQKKTLKELHTDGFRFQAEVEECVIISKSTTVTWSH